MECLYKTKLLLCVVYVVYLLSTLFALSTLYFSILQVLRVIRGFLGKLEKVSEDPSLAEEMDKEVGSTDMVLFYVRLLYNSV